MIIRAQAYPRAGLIGNPSDGYFGKTMAFVFRNFHAEVVLHETPEIEIMPSARDHSRFKNLRGLVEDVRRFGYYGGVRLLKATIKRFHDYCRDQDITLEDRGFTIQYDTNIPAQVGLAGSSAIITAGLRALMQFYKVQIPKPTQANLILAVEKHELGISAGLQDRVAQVYEGLVYMDFNRALSLRQGYGNYEQLSLELLPPLYIAYRTDLSENSDVFHNDIRNRFERGEPDVIAAMAFWADLAEQARMLLLKGTGRALGPLLNASAERRRRIYKLSAGNIAMLETAQSVGASATFTGSGGAIVGTYEDTSMFQNLTEVLAKINVNILKPDFSPPRKDAHDS